MTASEFMAIAPMFASEDVTRPSLHEPSRCGDRLFVTDGRIALAHRARFTELCKIAETTDEKRRSLGKSIMGMIESNDAKIASGKYQGFGLCSMMEAVIAAFANVEPEMMWLRANEPDEDDPDADGSPDSVRHVHESFTSVIMANPARSVIAGYYASLIAGLMKYHGPVEAYADASDPHAMLYFRGPDWNCALMPRMVCSKGTCWEWNCFGGCSIADAWTGSLVYGRDEEGNPDMDALRKGVKA